MNFKFFLVSCVCITSLAYGQGVEDAIGYHFNSSLQALSAKSIIQTIPWVGNERVLDIGCGDGKITAWIAENFSKGLITGIDISESMIQFASNHYSADRFQNLRFFRDDAASLNFDKQFDIIVSFAALHWVMDQESVLQSIFKALVPGGRGYILTYGKNQMNLLKIGESLIYSEKWAQYFPDYTPQRIYYTPEEYLLLLRNAGFKQIELTAELTKTTYPNCIALKAFVLPLLNFIQHLPEKLREQFVNEFVDQIVALSAPTEDGSVVFEVLNLNASFQRP